MRGLIGSALPDLLWLPFNVALVIVGGDGLTWLADRIETAAVLVYGHLAGHLRTSQGSRISTGLG